jgi:pSer/pThr/pTyr-binding forkhead associated (FHA) protein
MQVKLVLRGGKYVGKVIDVAGPRFFIGRSEDCQLRAHSQDVSRHHCAIMIEEGYVCVRDFASRNGTFVNDEQVHGEQELHNGDRLKVGNLDFEVELVVPVAGKKKPKVRSISEAVARTAQVSRKDEGDVDDWLNDGEPEPATKIVAPKPAPAPAAAQSPAPPVSRQPPKTPASSPDDVMRFWKGDDTPKPTAANSRSAAADALKQLFKNS